MGGRRSKLRRAVEKPIGGFDAHPATLIATFGGIGFFPVAPATVASAVVAVLLVLIGSVPLGLRLLALAAVTIAGTWASGRVEARYGEDPRCVVIDEVAGMLVATLLVPWELLPVGAAFLLFRFFDVVKVPPAYQLESLGGGRGIMADDLVAGLYALVLLLLAGLLLPSF